LKRRVASLETAIARLQLLNKESWKRGWDTGFRRGKGQRARNFDAVCGKYDSFKRGCVTSKEELKHLNHAYGGAG
jgi:hypothetical protein